MRFVNIVHQNILVAFYFSPPARHCQPHAILNDGPLQFYSVGSHGNAIHMTEQFMHVCHFLQGGCDILRLSGSSCPDLLDFLSVV